MLLFHTDNLPQYGLERIFQFAKAAGYDGLEVGVGRNFDTQNPDYIKQLSERYDLPVKAFSIVSKQEENLSTAYQHTVREFEGITMNLIPAQSLSFKYKKWMDEIVPKLARKYNLMACRRNVPMETMLGFLPNRSDNSVMALRQAGNVCLDLTALALSNDDIMKSLEEAGSALKHVYLSNVHRKQPYSSPIHGVLPLESFLTKLARKDFRGNFTLYVKAQELGEGDDDRVIAKMVEAREFFEKYFVADSNEV